MKFFLLLFAITAYGDLFDHLKKAEGKGEDHGMRNIDFLYTINLDRRPEKWNQTFNQLSAYGIFPYRFSAVVGWDLALQDILDVGLLFTPGMEGGFWGTTFRLKKEGEGYFPEMKEGHCGCSYPFSGDFIWEQKRLGEIGTVYFCHCMERGTIGICLSHISVLNDAYESGYETIWVMEDDIEVVRDPRVLSDLIDELDQRTGGDWDILFTDRDIRNNKGEYIPASAAARRPDFVSSNDFTRSEAISATMRRVGARYGAHSMIVRRQGMEKLLQFFQEHKIFLPYDMEYTLPPGIKLYTVVEDVVTNLRNGLSDNGHPRYLESSLNK